MIDPEARPGRPARNKRRRLGQAPRRPDRSGAAQEPDPALEGNWPAPSKAAGNGDGQPDTGEATADAQAMTDAVDAIIRAGTVDDVIRSTLDAVRKSFGWDYGSYWSVDPGRDALVFSLESGSVDEEFNRVTRSARFRRGEGLNGRSWK